MRVCLNSEGSKILNLRSIAAGFAAALLFISGCSGGGSSTPSTPSSDRVSITPSVANVIAGGSVQLSATLTLSSGAVDLNAVFTWQSDDTSIASIDAKGIVTGIKVGVATITATAGTVTGSALIGVVASGPGAAALTLSGNAAYEDREFNAAGFTGILTQKPIRNAVIEVVAIDGFKLIGTGVTNASGDFNLTVNNSANRAGIYLRVVSLTDPANNTKIEIQNNASEKLFLSSVSAGIDDSGSDPFTATQNVLATADARIGGAFNILDVILDTSALIQTAGPCPSPNIGCIPPKVTVYWEPGSKEGTFFNDSVDAISILGGGGFGGDTDEYDDVVIIHEYGHFILSKFSRDDSPGGEHNLFDNGQDIRLSWSEGWGNFLPFAVRNSPLYVDTLPGGIGISFNIEDYSTAQSGNPLSAAAIYTTNEIAVAGVLWDLFDEIDPSENDALDLGFTKIFQTVLNFPQAKPSTLETFWTTFSVSASTAAFNSEFQAILQSRQIKLFKDTTEDVETALLLGVSQQHTLYKTGSDPSGDVDRIPFSVTSGTTYTVKTLNLSNGADTFLTIFNPSNVTIESNDNTSGTSFFICGLNSSCPKNNASNLSSKVTFTAQMSGTYTAEVSHAENAPPSAGLLGAYEIQLTSP